MIVRDINPHSKILESGTPRDYSADVYRVYFEVLDPTGIAGKIIADFVGPERATSVVAIAHGYETELPIQCVPEIIRMLSHENIAIYQVVRYERTISGGSYQNFP